MNNLLSYFGLVDAGIRASDKDLPVNANPFSQKGYIYYISNLVQSIQLSAVFLSGPIKSLLPLTLVIAHIKGNSNFGARLHKLLRKDLLYEKYFQFTCYISKYF